MAEEHKIPVTLDWELKVSPEVQAQIDADPELAETVRDLSARLRQATSEFEAGRYKSMEDALAAMGAKPVLLDDDDGFDE
jgi:hypothetical protein